MFVSHKKRLNLLESGYCGSFEFLSLDLVKQLLVVAIGTCKLYSTFRVGLSWGSRRFPGEVLTWNDFCILTKERDQCLNVLGFHVSKCGVYLVFSFQW